MDRGQAQRSAMGGQPRRLVQTRRRQADAGPARKNPTDFVMGAMPGEEDGRAHEDCDGSINIEAAKARNSDLVQLF
ncbi:hypothetical protein ACFSTI_22190 [Rhizorhabdus histidinilytica]